MTPKEKAIDLLCKYNDEAISKVLIIQGNPFNFGKLCALIAVKEIILALKQARQWTEYLSSAFADIDNDMNYWINVHKELEKL